MHRNDHGISDVDSLYEASTFYIVDPGASTTNCLPDTDFLPRTIIVSSPDERNWGGKQFMKGRDDVAGLFRFFPMWDLDELVMARQYIRGRKLTDEEIAARFREVGGIPRHIFATDAMFSLIQRSQDDGIDALTRGQAQKIFHRRLDAVGSFGPNKPKSAIIGYAKAQTQGKISFSDRVVDLVSISVAEKIVKRFMSDLWDLMFQDEIAGWKTFETYCRILMSTPAGLSFDGRLCCGKRNKEYKIKETFTLGGCNKVRFVSDIGTALIAGEPMTLFHSTNPTQALYDFFYKDNNGMIHAFQVTLGKTHKVESDMISDLRKTIGISPLKFYFLIPSNHYNVFVTDPRIPTTDELTKVWHILIPNPNKGSRPDVK